MAENHQARSQLRHIRQSINFPAPRVARFFFFCRTALCNITVTSNDLLLFAPRRTRNVERELTPPTRAGPFSEEPQRETHPGGTGIPKAPAGLVGPQTFLDKRRMKNLVAPLSPGGLSVEFDVSGPVPGSRDRRSPVGAPVPRPSKQISERPICSLRVWGGPLCGPRPRSSG